MYILTPSLFCINPDTCVENCLRILYAHFVRTQHLQRRPQIYFIRGLGSSLVCETRGMTLSTKSDAIYAGLNLCKIWSNTSQDYITASCISTLRPPVRGTGLGIRSSSSTSSRLLSIRPLLCIRLITITAEREQRRRALTIMGGIKLTFCCIMMLDRLKMLVLLTAAKWACGDWQFRTLHHAMDDTIYTLLRMKYSCLSHIGLELNPAGTWPSRSRIAL